MAQFRPVLAIACFLLPLIAPTPQACAAPESASTFFCPPTIDAAAWQAVPTIDWDAPPELPPPDESARSGRSIGVNIPAPNLGTINILNHGQWTLLADGANLFHARIAVPQALALRINVLSAAVPADAVLTIGDAEGHVAAQYFELADTMDRAFWTPTVRASAVLIELWTPAGADPIDCILEVSDVAAITAPLEAPEVSGASQPLTYIAEPCHLDAACEFAADAPQRASVVRLEYIADKFPYMCTGFLIEDGDPRTNIPWVVTARHAIATQDVADTVEAHFFEEHTQCSGTARMNVQTRIGANYIISLADTDFSLLRLLQDPPPGAAFAQWEIDPPKPSPDDPVSFVHYPGLTQKRVGAGILSREDPCTSRTALAVDLRGGFGFGENGSDGAPLFDSQGLLIGQLIGQCLNGDFTAPTCETGPQRLHTFGDFRTTTKDLELDKWLATDFPDDPYEPNNAKWQAIFIEPGKYRLALRDPYDYFWLRLDHAAIIDIDMEFNGEDMDASIALRDDKVYLTKKSIIDGKLLAYSLANKDGYAHVRSIQPAGLYEIRVSKLSLVGRRYKFVIKVTDVPWDLEPSDYNINDLAIILRSFGQHCDDLTPGCPDISGDGVVNWEDIRLAMAGIGINRSNFTAKEWRKISKFIGKQLKEPISLFDKEEAKRTLRLLSFTPTEEVQRIATVIAYMGQHCGEPTPQCPDLTDDGWITDADLHVALLAAGIDRNSYDDDAWVKLARNYFKREIRPVLAGFPWTNATYGERALTYMPRQEDEHPTP
ncbi:MAG: trypsin-like peptidase domain-containing protein [Phycisphaerales bacterium]|nr:trypsin-like peptidase domain-containing protein [Phycisphaerales bacterium]